MNATLIAILEFFTKVIWPLLLPNKAAEAEAREAQQEKAGQAVRAAKTETEGVKALADWEKSFGPSDHGNGD